MKNTFIIGFITGLLAISLFGCATTKKIFGKSAKAENVARQEISQIEKTEAKTSIKRLDKIGEYSYGISIVPSNPPPVTKLNERITSLANQPTEEAKKEMQAIVSELVTNNNKLLLKKDKELAEIQREKLQLQNEKEAALTDYMNLASATAMRTDTLQSSLNQMDSWGGIGAIWYGTKKLITRFMWGIGIFSVIFLVLRIASMSNPIAASIFSIFNMMGSWLINIIKVLVPKAVDIAGHVATDVFNAYKSTLTKVVDAVQAAKLEADKNGGKIDIKTILDELSKSMNDDEKKIVDELKKALNY